MNRILDCPFCGSQGKLEKEPLWVGTHGYHGCYDFFVRCSNDCCRVQLIGGRFNSVYTSEEDALGKAIKKWNQREWKNDKE